MSGRILGYEVGEFERGEWIGFADCTPVPQPREVVEGYLKEWNTDARRGEHSEYRIIEIREAE